MTDQRAGYVYTIVATNIPISGPKMSYQRPHVSFLMCCILVIQIREGTVVTGAPPVHVRLDSCNADLGRTGRAGPMTFPV